MAVVGLVRPVESPRILAQGEDCPTETYLAGVQDDFSTTNGQEMPVPDPRSHAAWGSPYVKQFDLLPQGWVFHTFNLSGTLESPICGAFLETRVKPDASDPLVFNDNLQFSFGEGWHEWIGAFGTAPSSIAAALFPYPWGSGAGAAEDLSVDMRALPLRDGTTQDLVGRLNAKGFVDVIVVDDTAADYFALHVQRCCTVPPTPTDEPPSPTPTDEPPSATPTDEPPSATPSDTPVPPPTSPPPARECVCSAVRRQVPSVAIVDALVNPERYHGWRMPLDPGKPPGPNNPLRECLNLVNPGAPYHPLFNKPIWEVGCR
jgi:hypothetical protein